jgi:lipopolysaccharide export system protein LptA
MTLRPILLPALLVATLLAAHNRAVAVEESTTTITSDGEGRMISTDQETTITFHNNVVVVGTDLKLTCDDLKVVVLRTGDPKATIGKLDKFRSLLATGNVHMVQGDREAACGRAEVIPGQDRVILTENPVVVDHDQNTRISGEKITLLKGQRQVLVEKPTLVGPPVKDLGFDKDKKPAASAPAATPTEPAKKP